MDPDPSTADASPMTVPHHLVADGNVSLANVYVTKHPGAWVGGHTASPAWGLDPASSSGRARADRTFCHILQRRLGASPALPLMCPPVLLGERAPPPSVHFAPGVAHVTGRQPFSATRTTLTARSADLAHQHRILSAFAAKGWLRGASVLDLDGGPGFAALHALQLGAASATIVEPDGPYAALGARVAERFGPPMSRADVVRVNASQLLRVGYYSADVVVSFGGGHFVRALACAEGVGIGAEGGGGNGEGKGEGETRIGHVEEAIVKVARLARHLLILEWDHTDVLLPTSSEAEAGAEVGVDGGRVAASDVHVNDQRRTRLGALLKSIGFDGCETLVGGPTNRTMYLAWRGGGEGVEGVEGGGGGVGGGRTLPSPDMFVPASLSNSRTSRRQDEEGMDGAGGAAEAAEATGATGRGEEEGTGEAGGAGGAGEAHARSTSPNASPLSTDPLNGLTGGGRPVNRPTDANAWAQGVQGEEVIVGIVVDEHLKYVRQAVLWLETLRWFGGSLNRATVLVCVLPGVTEVSRQRFRDLGAIVRPVRPLTEAIPGATPHANKIRLLQEALLVQAEATGALGAAGSAGAAEAAGAYRHRKHAPPHRPHRVLLYMDCDILVLSDPVPFLRSDAVMYRAGRALWGQVALELPITRRMFELFGVSPRVARDMVGWANTGVLSFPMDAVAPFLDTWMEATDKFGKILLQASEDT